MIWSFMGASVGLLWLLILLAFTGSTAGTLVTSCDSCHNEATCLESPERGDSFITHRLSCVCKDGFVGDGITCYNTELCSDSSCCSQGYHWSAESGCEDIDECSLPDSPCPLPQVCQNTPGSFECLQPSSSTRSGPSSQSVVFDCGHTICPAGMDCVAGSDGIMTCVDPCETYSVLNEDWRAINNTSTQDPKCDTSFNGKTWYRFFLWQTSAHIPERCVAEYRCGAETPMWISTPHPTQSGVIERHSVCGHYGGRCCHLRSSVYIKLCYESFFVYRLYNARFCSSAYCAVVNRTEPPVDSTTPYPGPQTTTHAITTRPTYNRTVLPTHFSTPPAPTLPPTFRPTIPSPTANTTVVEGDVRLVNGNSSCSGRVEIFHRGQWGTVCDDSWGLFDAQVVCRQLGCGRVLSAPISARFGPGRGPIWLDDVACAGSESKLTECRHRGFGSHDCSHSEDAGVVCEAGSPVRLVNSDDRCSGRVEVYHNGHWGTVCDDSWDLRDANVVCRQLDCGSARSALQNAAFGPGSGPIWLDDVTCYGYESSITDCRHPGFGVHNCVHYEDASVVCQESNSTDVVSTTRRPSTSPLPPTFTTTIPSPTANTTVVEGDVRLVNGNSSCSGRVEIFHRGQWGTVCDDSWGLFDAQVVCRQLGCGRVLSAPISARFGPGRGPIWLDDVACAGSESKLTECRHRGFGSHDCSHSEDAGVVCEAGSPVRLVNSDDRCSGRVEVYHNGHWGTVCDDSWDLRDANVVCRQLDCGSARSALQNAAFGPGSGPIWLDDVNCYGYESSITDCRHPGFGVHNCGHYEDASVVCDSTRPPLQHSNLICGRDKLSVGLDVAHLASFDLDAFSGNLADRNCSWASVSHGVVWYEVEAKEGACGNTLRINDTHAIYSNNLFIYSRNNDSSASPERLPFACAYPLDTYSQLNVALKPVLESEGGISGSGAKSRASMYLFVDSNYTVAYLPGLVTLPVGSRLYVGVFVEERDPDFVVVLEDCYASHSPNPNDTTQQSLIRNKCPTDKRQVSVTESGSSLQARFSALFFLVQNEYRTTYLHCGLSLCNQRRFYCIPSCTRRMHRSVPSSETLEPLTIGPIVWETSSV